MSILRPGDTAAVLSVEDGSIREVDLREMGIDEESRCFLCGRHLRQLPAIRWGGSTGLIAFHPECATSFVLRLARDCWEYQSEASHRDQLESAR